ncbi:hypothetical protein [Streptomyces sp. NBC_00876]|uniref:hypothetical protein n=1 Tax=Streptomyces sp. NBC_00876 TaxID=2975853 RepID=UPI00386897DC
MFDRTPASAATAATTSARTSAATVWDNSDTATLRDEHGHKADSTSWGRHHHGPRR